MKADRAIGLALAGGAAVAVAAAGATRASGAELTVLGAGLVATGLLVGGAWVGGRSGTRVAMVGAGLLAAVVGAGQAAAPSGWGAIAEGTVLYLAIEAATFAADRHQDMPRPHRVEPDRLAAIAMVVALAGAINAGLVITSDATPDWPRVIALLVAGGATMALATVLLRLTLSVDRPRRGRARAGARPG